MIGKIAVRLCMLTLVACGSSKPADTVDSLAANPDRLKEVMQQCHVDHVKIGDGECNAASEAFRRRFIGGSQPPYASRP
jgi:hypothetical protein